MQNRRRDGGREGGTAVPEQGDGELVEQAKSPLAARLYLTCYFTRACLKSLLRDDTENLWRRLPEF